MTVEGNGGEFEGRNRLVMTRRLCNGIFLFVDKVSAELLRLLAIRILLYLAENLD